MKRNKLIFKVDCHRRGKIYVGKKWLKDVRSVNLLATPYCYLIKVEQNSRNEHGGFYTIDNEIATKTTIYRVDGLLQK